MNVLARRAYGREVGVLDKVFPTADMTWDGGSLEINERE